MAGVASAFFMPNGTPPMRGEMFRAPTLAKTLRELVAAEKKAHGKRAAKIQAVRELLLSRVRWRKRMARFLREETAA